MPDPVTHTIGVPGATLTYDVRGDLADRPVLLMFGSPMGASGSPRWRRSSLIGRS